MSVLMRKESSIRIGSDRVPVTNGQGSIVNAAGIIVGGQTNVDNALVILTPEFYAE